MSTIATSMITTSGIVVVGSIASIPPLPYTTMDYWTA